MPRVRSVVLALMLAALLAACAPAVPVTTAVPPTVTAAPTATLAPTLTPAPTDIPIPEGAVQAADGSALFVEDGKLFTINGGNKIEANLDNYTFNNIDAPQELLVQLNPELFQGDQAALVEFLMPGGFVAEGEYYYAINNVRWGAGLKKGSAIVEVVGKNLDVVEVKAPADYPADSVYVSMIAINGMSKPFPLIVGVKKNNVVTQMIGSTAEFNLLQSVSEPTSVDVCPTIQTLEKTLKNERIRIFVPIGVINSAEKYLNIGYSKYSHNGNETVIAAQKYFVDTFGERSYSFLESRKFDKEGRPSGYLIGLVITDNESDESADNFIGFLPNIDQIHIFHNQ